MHQIIAALAAAFALLAGGSPGALHPSDASLPTGMAKPAPTASPANAAGRPITPRPMDASLPTGM